MNNLVINVPSEYISLGLVMQSALEQASKGKGRERHASEGEAYEDQIICEVARRVGLGYPLGQAVKKIYESQRLIPQLGVQELLGAMNYLAAAVIVMQERMEEEGRRFREGFSHAEGDRCQSGNDQPELKPGDRVQYRDETPSTSEGIWVDAEYVRHLPDGRGYIVQDEKRGSILVGDKDIRPAPKADEEPEFQRGDKVEVQMVPDSSTWASATITAVYRDKDTSEWRYCVDFEDGWAHLVVPSARVRPVSAQTAEGCEELVQKDAPQTPAELYDKIIASNPATFKASTPTGEELAEMAEEEKRG